MLNVVGGGIALLCAIAWFVLDTATNVLWEYVEKGVRSITHSIFEEERIESSSSCLPINSFASSSHHRRVIERFVSVIEREVEWFESRTSAHSALSLLLDHSRLFLLFSCIFLCFFCWCSFQQRFSRSVQHDSARMPDPRPVLQRGGGTLA